MILCFLFRRKLAACVDDGLYPDRGLRRHIESCVDCRRSYEQELALAQGLTRTALRQRVVPSPFLEGKIMAALDHSSNPTPAGFPLSRLAWAAAVGVIVVVTLLFRALHGPSSPSTIAGTPVVWSVTRELAALEKGLPNQDQLGQWSTTLDQPLDKEMQALLHDARNVAQALVLNFVPESVAQPLAGRNGDQ